MTYLSSRKVIDVDVCMEFRCSTNVMFQGSKQGKIVIAQRYWVFFNEDHKQRLAQRLSSAASIGLCRRVLGPNYLTDVVVVERADGGGSDVVEWRLFPKGVNCKTLLNVLQATPDGPPFVREPDDLWSGICEAAKAVCGRVARKLKAFLPLSLITLASALPIAISLVVLLAAC